MNKVEINEKDDSIFSLGRYWLCIYGGLWVKGVEVQNDHENEFLKIYIERTISILL